MNCLVGPPNLAWIKRLWQNRSNCILICDIFIVSAWNWTINVYYWNWNRPGGPIAIIIPVKKIKKRVTFLLYPIKIGTGFFMKWQLSKLSTQMLFSNFVQNDMLAVDTYKANQNFGPTIFYLSIVSKHPKSSWVFTNQKILRKINEKRI